MAVSDQLVPYRPVRLAALGFLAASLLLGAACGGRRPPENGLSGEWSVMLTAPHPAGDVNGPTLSAEGVVVFSSRMPRYDFAIEAPAGALFGRAYIDFEPVLHSGRHAVRLFGSGPGVDLREEAVALPDSGVGVRIVIAPEMIGWNPEFHGTVANDTIRGEWFVTAHLDTLQRGVFVMTRRPSGAYTDSAFARARRGIRESHEETPPAPGEVTDTAPPASAP